MRAPPKRHEDLKQFAIHSEWLRDNIQAMIHSRLIPQCALGQSSQEGDKLRQA